MNRPCAGRDHSGANHRTTAGATAEENMALVLITHDLALVAEAAIKSS